jgi:hypothetical protein
VTNPIRVEEKNMNSPAPPGAVGQTGYGSNACEMQGKGWFKGGLAMAICCAAPVLLIAAFTLFGISLGALASGFLSLAALLACPVGMYVMMRMMNKKE